MKGRACVEVFPNSTLYDDDKVLEAMLAGDVQVAAPSLSNETFTKKLRLGILFAFLIIITYVPSSPPGCRPRS